MDTITHGIAGALIGKALFRGEDLISSKPVNHGRIISWSLMLGAIFPDSDVFREMFSHDRLLIITWHRSITHSLILMPLWALLLAWLTHAFTKWRKWEAPSFATLAGIYAVGILSHILLDLVTSFGTMIWSPLAWTRPTWDLIFIVDFTLSGLFLVPQFLAWVYAEPGKERRRAVGMWLVFLPVPFLISRIGENVGAPISDVAVLTTVVVLAAIFLLPGRLGWGTKVPYATWNRVGLAASLVYIACAFYAHHVALLRVEQFAELYKVQPQAMGALPLPPSVWHWDGLVRGERGVYELRLDLSDKQARTADPLTLEHRFFPDAPSNSYIEAARKLPEVQKVLWFSRFPVTRFRKEGDNAVVDFSDIRFSSLRRDRPASFTYRVKFRADGAVISQGWLTR